ncbi:hypothetical protein I6J21_10895 [Corynebacterium glucuronolyticum]|uniref:Uncharacterized protein n=3 Tax=Corynebacterium glucuronolyticum TaxID=39791 RepID=A0AAX1LD38_9CORY|nr:hypothetical protein HMPREF0293_0282 [Corynebacterium glucuronolyticum ATCC 51866]QRP71932.1 hypothetical protein I6J21_10895 [Corynebacterium glucuronolyticum]
MMSVTRIPRPLLAFLGGLTLFVIFCVVWLWNADPLKQALTRASAENPPVAVNLAEIYHLNATEIAVQCGYQSNSDASRALGISARQARDLKNNDADEVVYFRDARSSLLKVVTLPSNAKICDDITSLTWIPNTPVCFTPDERWPGLWRGRLCAV